MHLFAVSTSATCCQLQLCLLQNWQPPLPTPEEAYDFCMKVWESDPETEKKRVKEKLSADEEIEAATSAAESTQPDEPADDSAEVVF